VPTTVPRHNREPAARGGNLHNRDNLVPKLSPEANCMDLSQYGSQISLLLSLVFSNQLDVTLSM
jgi:hypothetical protein